MRRRRESGARLDPLRITHKPTLSAIGMITDMAERVLTRSKLNRALVARQLLLERRQLPLPDAVEQLAGLQAQYTPSPYLALLARLETFERDHLTARARAPAAREGAVDARHAAHRDAT